MCLAKIMRDLRQLLPGNPDQIRLVEVTCRDDYVRCSTLLFLAALVDRMYNEAAILLRQNGQRFFISGNL